jgi:hypothetical protein
LKLTLEQRIARAERVLKMFLRRGRKYRKEFRESVNIVINAQIATEDQLKRTGQQIKETGEQIKKTGEQLEALTASQAKTDEALRRFIDSVRKGQNGNSSH